MYLVVSSMGSNDLPASASVMLVPPPPKSSSAITPCDGNPGLACNAVSDVTASDTSRGDLPSGTRVGSLRKAVRKLRSAPIPQ